MVLVFNNQTKALHIWVCLLLGNLSFLQLITPYQAITLHCTRRDCIRLAVGTFASTHFPSITHAKPSTPSNPLGNLIEAQETLDKLLTNYERATIDCTFADVPRELLETKNKELLLEKAATNALFDKSASVETCKTTNRIVRDYLGVTGKGPLVGIEKQMKSGLAFVDPDLLDDYVFELEAFSQAYSKATSLSYTAGIADLDSVNNFSKDDSDISKRDNNSNLQQTKQAISEAKQNIDGVIALLQKS